MNGNIIEGQPFTITYTLNGSRGGDFAPPVFNGFNVSAPSQRSEFKNINGKSSQSFSIVYTVIPLKPGSASIGPASIRVGNKRLRVEGKNYNVIEAKKGSQEAGTPFVQASIPKDTVYLGEVIPLEYKLYVPYPYQKKGQRITIPPTFEGFFVENSSLYYSEDILIEGTRYTAYIIDRKYLYPHQSGKLNIPSIAISYNVVHQNDRFGFFGSGGKTYTSKSEEKTISVLPLPNPEPISFTGGVGEFDFEWETDKTSVSTDDVFKVRLKIQGNGDLKSIKAPDLDLQADSFEVFPPKIIGETSNEYRNGTLLSARVYEYMITPLKSGKYKVPVNVCFFSPDSMDYINSPDLTLNMEVSQGKGIQFSNVPVQEESTETKLVIQDPVLNSFSGDQSKNPWIKHWTFWVMLILPLGFTGGLWLNDRYQLEYAELNKQKERVSKALENAESDALNLSTKTEKSNTERFNELNNIVYNYISARFGNGQNIQSIQSSIHLLEKEGIDLAHINQLKQQLKDFEMLAFGMPVMQEFKVYIDKLLELLKKLD